jgi:hypothetical protein
VQAVQHISTSIAPVLMLHLSSIEEDPGLMCAGLYSCVQGCTNSRSQHGQDILCVSPAMLALYLRPIRAIARAAQQEGVVETLHSGSKHQLWWHEKVLRDVCH